MWTAFAFGRQAAAANLQRCAAPNARRWINDSVGIIGLPNTGKSTLFNVLTSTSLGRVANFPFATIDPVACRVNVEDATLTRFARFASSQKVVHSNIEFIDIAGLVKGAHEGEGLGNEFLSQIRRCDALLHVVRCFNDNQIIHVEQDGVNPVRDVETIRNELILADLNFVEKSIQNNAKKMAKQRGADNSSATLDAVLQKCKLLLEDGKDVTKESFAGVCSPRDTSDALALSANVSMATSDKDVEQHWPIVQSLLLLTSKPVIYVCNIDEPDSFDAPGNDLFNGLKHYLSTTYPADRAAVFPIAIRLEEEISALDSEESKEEYREMYNLKSGTLQKLVQLAFDLLRVHSFYTIGPMEARSWTIHIGDKAEDAAAKIHSDFLKKFVKAEVIDHDDFPTNPDFATARTSGKARYEGRDYVVKSRDVILFAISK